MRIGRYAFGRPIASYQAIKHKLADMYVKNTLARSNAYFGAWALNSRFSTGACRWRRPRPGSAARRPTTTRPRKTFRHTVAWVTPGSLTASSITGGRSCSQSVIGSESAVAAAADYRLSIQVAGVDESA